MVQKVGIDAGGSLIKIAYIEGTRLHVKMFANENMSQVIKWLKIAAPDAHLYVTGGKSEIIQQLVSNPCELVEEFSATVEGAKFLLNHEQQKDVSEFLLVSIGTGTSIYHVNGKSFSRLLGSGIGGGTFMGLGTLLGGEHSFRELVEMAKNGNKGHCDLLVKDIYAPSEAPLLGELTAANFGKAHVHQGATHEDQIASLIQMMGEMIISLACQSAALKQVQKIIFVGSTLNGNEPLKDVLKSFQNLYPYEPIFLDKGPYAGAIGSLNHINNP